VRHKKNKFRIQYKRNFEKKSARRDKTILNWLDSTRYLSIHYNLYYFFCNITCLKINAQFHLIYSQKHAPDAFYSITSVQINLSQRYCFIWQINIFLLTSLIQSIENSWENRLKSKMIHFLNWERETQSFSHHVLQE